MRMLSERETQEVAGGDACVSAVGAAIAATAAANIVVAIGVGIVAASNGFSCAESLATGSGGWTNDVVGAGIDTQQVNFL